VSERRILLIIVETSGLGVQDHVYLSMHSTGLDFIIKDLPSVLILIIADQILNDSRCCS